MSTVPTKDTDVIFREIWNDYGQIHNEDENHLELYLSVVAAMAGLLFAFIAAVFMSNAFVFVPLVALGAIMFLISGKFLFSWSKLTTKENETIK